MAIYPMIIGRCDHCQRPATHQLMRSGSDPRAYACGKHVHTVGRALAARLGEEYLP